MNTNANRQALKRLEQTKASFGRGLAESKQVFLDVLSTARLEDARSVSRLHATLVWMRAYPDDARILRSVVRMLESFGERADVMRHREELEDSGIAGTDIVYSLYAPMARWLARKAPETMHVDWETFEHGQRLKNWLTALALPQELPALFDLPGDARAWVERMRGPGESDAAFLVRRFAALNRDRTVRDVQYEDLDLPIRLKGSPRTPSRTSMVIATAETHFQQEPLRTARPDLSSAVKRAPVGIHEVSASKARRLIDMSREAMVTRARHLDSFAYADPRDVRVVDCGEGLQFACMGIVPEQRCLLEALYGFITLKNGVPTGYVLASALCGSAEVAYNVFDEFRGGEAGYVYGRALAMIRALFGVKTFTIFPYQLGHGNDEGLASGAWWFYQKLGFRPRDRGARELMRRELAAMKRRSGHRTARRELKLLAQHNVFWPAEKTGPDAIGVLPIPQISLRIMNYLGRRFGSDRARATNICANEAAECLDATGWRRWFPSERLAFERWAPLVLLLPGMSRWSKRARSDLVAIIRAKGGRRETDYVTLFDCHRQLRRALVKLGSHVVD